jgi:hypothetical protein
MTVEILRRFGPDYTRFSSIIRLWGEIGEYDRALKLAEAEANAGIPDSALCQARCHGINVKEKRLILESAIQVMAGDGREDRMINGSYIALREEELRKKQENMKKQQSHKKTDEYIPDFLK